MSLKKCRAHGPYPSPKRVNTGQLRTGVNTGQLHTGVHSKYWPTPYRGIYWPTLYRGKYLLANSIQGYIVGKYWPTPYWGKFWPLPSLFKNLIPVWLVSTVPRGLGHWCTFCLLTCQPSCISVYPVLYSRIFFSRPRMQLLYCPVFR